MTRLPWFTLIAAAALILNSLGQDIVGSAMRYSPTHLLRDFWVLVALVGVAVLVVMGGLEAWYRGLHQRAKARNSSTEI